MEEKSGVLHIFFIFVGLALLGLGLFYYFTDVKIDLHGLEENNTNTNTDENNQNNDKDLISQISLMKNVETTITLKNKKEVQIAYLVESETNAGKFVYNGKTTFNTESVELCDAFYLYNNSIITFCTSNTMSSNHLYIVNQEGTTETVSTFNYSNIKYVPKSISLRDGNLIITGNSVLEDSIVKYLDNDLHLCTDNEIKNNEDLLNLPIDAEFIFKIKDGLLEFNYVKSNRTIKDYIYESCKTVE